MDIMVEAKKALTATPPTIIPVGSVAKYLISINVEPIIPLSNIVTTGGVEPRILDIKRIVKFRLNTKCQYRQIETIQL